tara:strand:+ start:66 stop:194 length:129 start_codon:yes stop_codon:yes gene_type:complete
MIKTKIKGLLIPPDSKVIADAPINESVAETTAERANFPYVLK